jgi:S-DNA-T family DNA segregation ATPase FtsK/SpoIIIE
MHALRRSFDDGFVSDEMRTSLGQRVREAGGCVLIALAALAGLALATWSVHDPSLSHATSAPVRNLLGATGAIAADLMMQLFGIASVALILPIAVWGWRLVSHRPLDRERARLALWLAGTLLAAGFAACLPTTPRWPLPTGLGGVIGDAILRLPAFVLGGPLGGTSRIAVALLAGSLGLLTLAIASGFGWRETPRAEPDLSEEDEPTGLFEGRAFVSLGLLYHGLFSLKARLKRIIAGGIAWRPGLSRRMHATSASPRLE